MDINNPHTQSYWFVHIEDQNKKCYVYDQSNVIISSNNFTIQNPSSAGQDARYIVDAGDRQFIQIDETPVVVHESVVEANSDKDIASIKCKEEDNFWNRHKIKLLLTMCLECKNKNSSKEKIVWDEIAAHLDTTADECIKKYRNLRRTFIRLWRKKRLGREIKWVHYNICEEVFKDCQALSPSVLEPWEEHRVRLLLTLYIDNLSKFRSSDCLQKDVWKEIAAQLETTEYNCYHKFKNLKRAYLNWLEKTKGTSKPIKWQYQHYFERIFYDYNPIAGPWDKNKTKLLIDAYIKIADKFKNPRYQKKELWKEIAASVGEDATSCDKKFRNLKQTYIRLKMKEDSGRCITKWRYYKDFETIYGGPINYSNSNQASSKLPYKATEEDYIKQLLTFYIENKERFKDPLLKKKTLWRQLSHTIGLTTEECDRKFRNLKQTYLRLVEKKKESGKSSGWPYYSYFEQIYEDNFGKQMCNVNVDNIAITQIQKIVHEVGRSQDNDKFELLVRSVEESNAIQRERNKILQSLLNRK